MDATHLEAGGLRSSINVDGVPVTHYGVQLEDDSKTITSWIASEPNKTFSISARLIQRLPEKNYCVRVFLDGHRVKSAILTSNSRGDVDVSSVRVSATEERDMMFGSLELTDDDTLLEASSAINLGEIKVLVHEIGNLVPAEASYFAPPQSQKVHERAKKGLVHNVQYGQSRTEPVNPRNNLHYTFHLQAVTASHIIRYRPLAILQANGIAPCPTNGDASIPRSPSPAPVASSSRTTGKRKTPEEDIKPELDLSDDDDDDDDIAVKEQELREQLARIEKMKERKAQRDTAVRPSKKIKREAISVFTPGEVIDLTI